MAQTLLSVLVLAQHGKPRALGHRAQGELMATKQTKSQKRVPRAATAPASPTDPAAKRKPRQDSSRKVAEMEKNREYPDQEFLTSNHGTRIEDDQNSLRAGERGPSLLEDFHLREKIT
ncbi:MAG: catalase, partial [Thermoanaerobaculia bacterium]|nr:catalase [Thermoanaerobaculia bacterium]